MAITTPTAHAVADLPPDPIVVHLGRRWTERGSTTDEPASSSFGELRAAGPAAGRHLRCRRGRASPTRVRAAGVADRVAGGLSFGPWAAAFERAACIVTIDTGATHVASAVKRPTVVLFEHAYFRLNSQEWSPYRRAERGPTQTVRRSPAALRASRAEIVAAVAALL